MKEEGGLKGSSQFSRRGFLKIFSVSLAAISGLILGIPALDAIISPALKSRLTSFSKAGKIGNIPEGSPVRLTVASSAKDAYLNDTEMHNVWAIKKSNSDIEVFSPICPHLGCSYNWDSQKSQFECPCHGSVFAENGKVISGPAPRSLDTLPTKIEGDELYVEWEKFQLGINKKVKI
ncbi:MAG: QcrA and Rieske domain-containing protein [Ignavibacteriaceae bacterium]